MLTTTATGSGIDMAMSTGGISSPMVAALEGAWSAIQARHPELPAVVIVLGAGSANGPSLTLGHFAAMRWRAPEPPDDAEDEAQEEAGRDEVAAVRRWAEVFVGGEGLVRGPADVLATLLHEAAHALAHVRGIRDTSRQGRWHNTRFKAVAEEVGISVEKDPRIGWSRTTLPPETRTSYAQVIAELRAMLRLHRAVEISGGGGAKKPATPPAVCGCGRKIFVSEAALAVGPIVCGLCMTEFSNGPATEINEDDLDP